MREGGGGVRGGVGGVWGGGGTVATGNGRMHTFNHGRSYLIVRYENKLEDKDQANDGGLGVMETKAGVDVFLLHEEAKQNQRDQQIDLHRK